MLASQSAGSGLSRRKASGSYYTPAPIVEHLLDTALDPLIRRATRDRSKAARNLLALRVCDPACGVGHFLIPAARRIARALALARKGPLPLAMRDVVRTCIYGVDLDREAVRLCRESLATLAGLDVATRQQIRRHVRHGNALISIPLDSSIRTKARATSSLDAPDINTSEAFHWAIEFASILRPAKRTGGFDLVIGNPPYLNQLQTATSISRQHADIIQAWSGGLVMGYADTAAAFLLLSARLTRRGGRVALVLPQSILAARDAGPIRHELARIATLRSLWLSGGRLFDASVHTCAPTLEINEADPPRSAQIARTIGLEAEPLASARCSPRDLQAMATWSPLAAVASGVPDLPSLASGSTIAQLATATADFRDQYYGLAGHIVEHASLGPEAKDDWERFPRLITTAMIEPGRCAWGVVTTRLLKSIHTAPCADRHGLAEGMQRWAASRLVPKILVATQTRVIECAVDDHGQWLPVTPIITVTPRDPAMIWHVAAAIMSPVAVAVAVRDFAGTALNPDAIKLSARQVMTLPLPTPHGTNQEWDHAATIVRELSQAQSPRVVPLLHNFARASIASFELPGAVAEWLFQWWTSRL